MAVNDPGQTLNGGTLPHIAGEANLQDTQVVVNDIIDRLNNTLQLQSFADSANKRFVQGYLKGRWPGGDFGEAISQTGKDVYTCQFSELFFAWDYTTNIQYWNDPTTGKTYMTMGPGGVKIAKTGFDATTATNDQLTFNSAQDTLKVVKSGTFSLTLNLPTVASGTSAGSQEQGITAIEHDLGYTPIVLLYQTNGAAVTPVVDGGMFKFTLNSFYIDAATYLLEADSTAFYFDINRQYYRFSADALPGWTGTATYKYYLLQETQT